MYESCRPEAGLLMRVMRVLAIGPRVYIPVIADGCDDEGERLGHIAHLSKLMVMCGLTLVISGSELQSSLKQSFTDE